KQPFKPLGKMPSALINIDIIEHIRNFHTEIRKKNAILFLSYPGYQDSSYLNSIQQIEKVENIYRKNGFNIIGNPERYMIPDSMMFNTPYHLNKKGADFRTKLFIEDYKKAQDYNIAHK